MTVGSRSDPALLAHIQERIARIGEYTRGDRASFFESTLVEDAVVRNLQTLAESTRRLSESLKASEPEIPWQAISGFRNLLVHGYLGIDLEAVWSVVETDLPPLAEAVERMAARVEGSGRRPDQPSET